MNEVIFILDFETYKDNLFDVASAVANCCDKIWFRVKGIDGATIYNLSKKLRKQFSSKYLIISELVDLAVLLKFNAVHLNENTSKLVYLKKRFQSLDFGYSAHSISEIKENGKFDYFTLSPIFFTKKDYKVFPLGALEVKDLNKNIFALGGINVENVSLLKNKGYKGVAGISFLSELEDIYKYVKHCGK